MDCCFRRWHGDRVRWMLLTLAALAGLIVVAGFVLGIRSQGMTPSSGLQDGRLRDCPDSPNCVCSESYAGRQSEHAIEPLNVAKVPAARAWNTLQGVIAQMGGTMVTVDDHYLHATFTSRLFRFVDDVEARIDEHSGVIQLRSASRVGRSDLGVNRNRVEAIRAAWHARLK